MRRPSRDSGIGLVALGLVLLFATRSVLEFVTAEAWEIGVLRYLGLFIVLLGLQWSWALRYGGSALRPARRRVAGVWVLLAFYVLTTTGLFLILAFSLLMAATLEVGLERAFTYSEALRRRLDTPGRQPR